MRSVGIVLMVFFLFMQSVWAESSEDEIPPEPKEESLAEIAKAHQRASCGGALFDTNPEEEWNSDNLATVCIAKLRAREEEAVDEQFRKLYKTKRHWTAYAGALGDSTGRFGAVAGGSVEVAAPICRFFGLDGNTAGYIDGGGAFAYNGRVRFCIPIGPFSLELAMQREKNIRVALSSAPSLLSGTYNSKRGEVHTSALRWLHRKWEITVAKGDLHFRSLYYPVEEVKGPIETGSDVSIYQQTWYETGFLGGDRELGVFVVHAEGRLGTDGSNIDSSTLRFSPLRIKGFRMPYEVYVDANLAAESGMIKDNTGVEPNSQETGEVLESVNYFGVDLQLMKGNASRQGTLSYSRRLLPGSSVRVLSENRLVVTGQIVRKKDTGSISGYGAITKEELRLEGTEPFSSALSYGVEGKYGRFLRGPYYLQLTTSAAQSYYASADRSRLQTPGFEVRAMASVVAGVGSD